MVTRESSGDPIRALTSSLVLLLSGYGVAPELIADSPLRTSVRGLTHWGVLLWQLLRAGHHFPGANALVKLAAHRRGRLTTCANGLRKLRRLWLMELPGNGTEASERAHNVFRILAACKPPGLEAVRSWLISAAI